MTTPESFIEVFYHSMKTTPLLLFANLISIVQTISVIMCLLFGIQVLKDGMDIFLETDSVYAF